MKLQTLVMNHDPQIARIGSYIETFPRRFKTPICMTLPPRRKDDWKLKVESLQSTDDYVKISTDYDEILIDQSMVK